MTAFRFNCPQCDQRVETTDDMVGQAIICPACSKSVMVPCPASAVLASPTVEQERGCPYCGSTVGPRDRYCVECSRAIGPPVPEEPPAEKTKKCPYCAETILASALKCKHCGEFLDGSVRRTTAGQRRSAPRAAVRNEPSYLPSTSPYTRTARPVETNVRQGALIGAIVCFSVGTFLMFLSLWSIIYAPLFFVAFILSFVAMAQRRVA